MGVVEKPSADREANNKKAQHEDLLAVEGIHTPNPLLDSTTGWLS